MADSSEKQASLPTKVAGANVSGEETNWLKVSIPGDAGVSDIIDTAGVYGAITVGTSAVEAKIGGSRLSARKSLTISNTSTSVIYWGYSSGVSVANGTPIYKKQTVEFSIGDNVGIYLISPVAAMEIRVTEGS